MGITFYQTHIPLHHFIYINRIYIPILSQFIPNTKKDGDHVWSHLLISSIRYGFHWRIPHFYCWLIRCVHWSCSLVLPVFWFPFVFFHFRFIFPSSSIVLLFTEDNVKITEKTGQYWWRVVWDTIWPLHSIYPLLCENISTIHMNSTELLLLIYYYLMQNGKSIW